MVTAKKKLKRKGRKKSHELDRTRTPDWLRDWKQLTHYAKLLSWEIFCLFLKNGASQYLFLFDILTKRTEPFRNLSYKPSTRLPFVLDGTLLLSNYGYAVSFVNLLLLGKKGWVPIGVIKEDGHVSFSIACTISTPSFLKRVLRGQCYFFLLLRRKRFF